MSFHTLKDMNNFGFWKSIKHPIKALAPMAGVTDTVFRRLIVKYSKQIDVVFTEFVSSNGLFLGDRDTLMETLDFSESERPIVAQFFSANPERIEKSARLAQELGFDGVDLNLGCPDRTVCKQGAGSEIIKNPKLAQELILAMKEGAGSLPVSVKTRVGYSKDSEIDNWISTLLEVSPSVLTLHARTRADMYKAPARWSLIKRAVEIRDDMKSSTLIIGNGDISSLGDLNIKISESGADGGMVGRATIGNPWFFNSEKHIQSISKEDRLKILIEYVKLFESVYGDKKNFSLTKKHYKGFVTGWEGSKDLRVKLMKADSATEVENIVEKHLK